MGKQKYNLIDGFEECAAEMYKSGKTLREIANVIGTYPGKVGQILKELGVKKGRQYKYINEHYFDIIDSEDKAYILGFLIADGCIRLEERKNVTSYRIAFSNNIDDSETIELIHSKICPNQMLRVYQNPLGHRKPQYVLQWTSEYMAKILEDKYNITNRKTYDVHFRFPFENVPSQFHRDVIRGFLDGDGCVQKHCISFVFNSIKFLTQVIEVFKDLFQRNPLMPSMLYNIEVIDGKTTKYWRLRIATGHGRRALIKDYLYNGATYFLTRKFAKF